MFHDSRMKNGGANIVLPGSRSRCVKGGLEDRGLDTESHWSGVGGFSQVTYQIELIVIKNLSNGGNW